MSLSLKELKTLSPKSLTKKLLQLKRPRLQSIAKQCAVKARDMPKTWYLYRLTCIYGNQPTIALLGALFESISGRDNETSGFGAIETPNNQPIYNPKYAPTPTNPASSKGQPTTDDTPLSCWKVTKSKELLELEKELKTITPYKTARSVRSRKQMGEGKESRLLSSVKMVRRSVKTKYTPRPTPRRIQVDSSGEADCHKVKSSSKSILRERSGIDNRSSLSEKKQREKSRFAGAKKKRKNRFVTREEEKINTEARSQRAHDKFLERMAAARQKRENKRSKV
eukprot:jgi/Picsp_1/1382/NSC_04861-R1_---NA---